MNMINVLTFNQENFFHVEPFEIFLSNTCNESFIQLHSKIFYPFKTYFKEILLYL